MVLSAVVATVALALAQADEPAAPDEEPAPEPAPDPAPPPPPVREQAPPPHEEPAWFETPRPKPRLNEDLRNGVVFSAERLFPLVTVQDLSRDRDPGCYVTNPCEAEVVPNGYPTTFRDPTGSSGKDTVRIGPAWDDARSLFDFPALAVDGAISGFTAGGSIMFGSNVGGSGTAASEAPVETSRGIFGVNPRIGYAVPIGERFALWPRLGAVVAVSELLKDDVNLLFVTTQLGALWFFTRHAALALTPAYHAPMTKDRTNVSRFAVDLGLTIAF